MVSLLFIVAIFSLSSCSRKAGTDGSQPPPAEVKFEEQSGNWKLKLKYIKKVPKPPEDMLTKKNPVRQHDSLKVSIDIEYTGQAGDIQSPTVGLVDNQGRRAEALSAEIGPMPGKPSLVVLAWINPADVDYKKKPLSLKSGEKLFVSYYFQDPKEYANLKLVFNDVPPLPLNVP